MFYYKVEEENEYKVKKILDQKDQNYLIKLKRYPIFQKIYKNYLEI